MGTQTQRGGYGMNVFLAFEYQPLLFENPLHLISCHDPMDLRHCFEKMEQWLDAGFYVAGYVSYEAGYAFEERLFRPFRTVFPLLRMGAFRRPAVKKLPPASGNWRIRHLRLDTGYRQYAGNIRRIRDYIAQGDVYQITYCIKNLFQFLGNPRCLFQDLYRHQRVPYAACVESEGHQILSLSPERFIRKKGLNLLAEPMKGTWHRGANPAQDRRRRYAFSRDGKNRAENVMIADLLRNDLGRLANRIRAPKLFTIRAYKTLFQMTSTVTGRCATTPRLYDLFGALFPSGSVTGAPKIRAMQIVREIEGGDRNIYTGAIGYIAPNRDLYFNVPIRTLLLRGKDGEMGVGGGIVWDSTAQGEWQEGLLKSRFLRELAAG
jgi:para-aminobenzoate synthetase/4-amino-4-deoxychorismate lyase